RDYIADRYRDLGLAPLGDDLLLPFRAGVSRMGGPVQGWNVAGVIRGSEHPDRYIVVTAHYDHEGVADGVVWNGADDNASGVAALLELARHFIPRPPRHSIVFLALDGEEQGLLGARAFTADPPVPLKAVAINVNLDMIAR